MRKSLIFTLLLACASSIQAREISPQQALSAARDFLGSTGPQKTASAVLKQTNVNDASQAYYVFNSNDKEGFVIISGDDRAPKVLGYSDSGSIDPANLPPQLKAILDRFSESISSMPDVKHKSWNAAQMRSDEKSVLIPTANWGQGYPYNTDCPVIDGEPTLTGCVATAMAIVMKHHNWPKDYNWNAMPMNTEDDPLDFENESPELARLMHEAGEAVYMEYSSYESGAYLDWIGHRMQNVFHYSPECQYLGWENFETDNWISMLKENLDKGNPVIYDGFGTGGHHAFILDGYEDDLYHVNWGWDGMANGYYALMDLTPFEGENFSDHQGMVINIEPDLEIGDYSECFVDYGYLWASGATRMAAEMNVSEENIEKGKPFHLFNSLITVPAGFEGTVGVAIIDKNKNIKEVLRTNYVSSYQSWSDQYAPTTVALRYYDLIPTCDIDSTDRLQLVSKNNTDQDYKLILGTMEWTSSRPVVGNTPQRCTITFNIGEGIYCMYCREGDGGEYKELPNGVTQIDGYIGEYYSLNYSKVNTDDKDPIHMSLHGNFFGGHEETWTGHDPTGYPFGIYATENSADIYLLHLEDQAIHLDTPGTLKDKIDSEKLFTLGELTISGKMNATDFWFIRDNCPNLTALNIKDVTIEEYTGGDGGWVPEEMTHLANTIPYMAIPSISNLETLILPENLEAIDAFSLQGLKLTSISIPAGVKRIGQDAFFGNSNLEAVEALNPEGIEIERTPFDDTKCPANGVLFVPEGASAIYADANVWKDFKKIIEGPLPDPLKFTTTLDNVIYECYIDEARITGWDGEPVDLVIPESFSSNGVVYTVTEIANDAFNQCHTLETVIMPNSIKTLGYNAFFWCENLKNVTLSENIEEIEYGTFQGCISLEEFTIGPKIKYIGSQALFGTGIKHIFIPKTLLVNSSSSAFGSNPNLDAFVVEEGNPCFTSIDGLLYRQTERGLSLESVPGMISGSIEIPGVCHDVMEWAFIGSNASQIIFNEGLETLATRSIMTGVNLVHLSLPKSVNLQEQAIAHCNGLESITFHGTPGSYAAAILDCPNLKHIYVESDDEEIVNLNGLFEDEYENLNLFSSKLDKNFEYDGKHTIFVPGACAERHESEVADVAEMWEYSVSPSRNLISIVPRIEGLSIDKVTINGRVVKPTSENNFFYQIEEDSQAIETRSDNDMTAGKELDVQVEYTIHDRQHMTTHYTPEFNATLPDDLPTGIGMIMDGSLGEIEVYGLDGIFLFKGNSRSALEQLKSGVYMIRRGNNTEKVLINR